MIDYGIVSNSLFQKVVCFKVHRLSFTSSHCPISFALRTKWFKINDRHDEDFLGKKSTNMYGYQIRHSSLMRF